MDRTADEIQMDLINGGEMPTVQEAMDLCDRALEADQLEAKFDALERALAKAGWTMIDVTTDDSDGRAIKLVPPTEGE